MSSHPSRSVPPGLSPVNVPADPGRLPMTLPMLAEKKRLGDPIVMVTAYDYPSARAAEAASVDLALVGDSADGYPGILGYGPKSAARFVERHGAIEDSPPEVLGTHRDEALLFKNLATLVSDASLFENVEELRWRGPGAEFGPWAVRIADPKLEPRIRALESRLSRV